MEKQTDNNARKGSIAAQIKLLQEAQNRVDPTGRARAEIRRMRMDDMRRMRMFERTPPYKTAPETAEALGKLPSETRVDEEAFTAMFEESHRDLTADAAEEPPADAPGASLPGSEYAAGVSASEAAERFRKLAEALRGSVSAAYFSSFCDGLMKAASGIPLEGYATPRQWHLTNYGSPKIRKKWMNALRRKAALAAKRHK